jgi:hypothetical protein
VGPWLPDDRGDDDVSWISGSCFTEQDIAVLADIEQFRRTHRQVIITNLPDGGWEVSLPGSAAVVYDDPRVMLQCLAYVSPDDPTT